MLSLPMNCSVGCICFLHPQHNKHHRYFLAYLWTESGWSGVVGYLYIFVRDHVNPMLSCLQGSYTPKALSDQNLQEGGGAWKVGLDCAKLVKANSPDWSASQKTLSACLHQRRLNPWNLSSYGLNNANGSRCTPIKYGWQLASNH